jgi:predicted transcriptional regulator
MIKDVKETEMRVKIKAGMKNDLEQLARVRGEVMSVIVRNAIYDYLRAHQDEIQRPR